MANNTLADLNNHLFAQLERLGDEDLTKEDLQLEMDRAKSIHSIAKNVIDNARITLDGCRFAYDNLPGDKTMPAQFQLKSGA